MINLLEGEIWKPYNILQFVLLESFLKMVVEVKPSELEFERKFPNRCSVVRSSDFLSLGPLTVERTKHLKIVNNGAKDVLFKVSFSYT